MVMSSPRAPSGEVPVWLKTVHALSRLPGAYGLQQYLAYPTTSRFRELLRRHVQVGSQHSQSLETYYAHVPGLKVVMPSTAYDAKGLLKTSIRDDNPVVFIEGETLYNTTWEVPEGEHLIPIGEADVKREGRDVTLIAWSKMVWICLDAAKALAEEGIECEVVDPRTLRPLDVETLAASVRKTGRCVIVEVGWPVAGFGAEVAYQMQRHCMDSLDAPIERVCSDDVPMPYAKNLEDEVQPQVKDVVAAVKRALYLE